MKHKHAELMMQYAQDAMETDKPLEMWQWRDGNNLWEELSDHPSWSLSLEYRRKPKMISVTLMNGEVVSWPEPHKGEISCGADYYNACEDGKVSMFEYKNSIYDNNCIRFGMVHLTKEAAEQHSHALFKINNQVAK